MGNTGKHRRERVPLTAQLVPGQDDDIIAWLGQLDKGGRATAIKEVVRAGLGLPTKKPATDVKGVVRDEIDQLRKQLDAWSQEMTVYLQNEMMRLLSEMSAAGISLPVAPATTEPDAIDPERKEKRDKRIKAAKW